MGAKLSETLTRFSEQFAWHPAIENSEHLSQHTSFIVSGMGGSHLGAWMIHRYDPSIDLVIHRNYGLPYITDSRIRNTLFIASSYSGSTEETLDAAKAAFEKGMHVAAVATGGALLDFARAHELPYITIPETGLEPRMAIGFSMLAIARLIGSAGLEKAIRTGGMKIQPTEHQIRGLELSRKLVGKIPMTWASAQNAELAYIWKIKFNETSKIPAFSNVFPELNHNEFTGLDVVDSTREIMDRVHVLILEDATDHPRIQKRMRLTAQMLRERSIAVDSIALTGEGFEKLFSSALYADWVSLGLAEHYGVPNPETPVIAEFKRRMLED
jgi:glucose/mannose-6-phosphate isomerase